MAKKPSFKGTTIPKRGPKQTSITDRRDRTLKHQTIDDRLAEIREDYYGKKHQVKGQDKSSKTKREEKLAVTGETGYEAQQKRRQTTSGMRPTEARKALAEQLKKRLNK